MSRILSFLALLHATAASTQLFDTRTLDLKGIIVDDPDCGISIDLTVGICDSLTDAVSLGDFECTCAFDASFECGLVGAFGCELAQDLLVADLSVGVEASFDNFVGGLTFTAVVDNVFDDIAGFDLDEILGLSLTAVAEVEFEVPPPDLSDIGSYMIETGSCKVEATLDTELLSDDLEDAINDIINVCECEFEGGFPLPTITVSCADGDLTFSIP